MTRGFAAHAAISIIASVILSACGGGAGGDSPPAPPPPAALPDSLTISAPNGLDTSAPIAFKQSIATPSSGLKFAWTFGDGATSTEVSPSYSYPKAGDYDVTLKVTNEAGSTREAKYRVSVNSMARLKGLVCSGGSESGWCWEQPRPTGTPRADVYFLDAKMGWTVGPNGEIFKTTDAGMSWVRQASGLRSTLTSIRFLDAQNGWAIGESGAFLRTVDGGTTWQLSKLPNEQSNEPPSFQLISDDRLLLTDAKTSYASADGGKTWRRLEAPATATSPKGVIWTIQSGALYRSTDMGATKTQVLEQVSTVDAELKVVSETTVLYGHWTQTWDYTTYSWVYGYTLKTSKDGGNTWVAISPQGLPADGAPRILQVVDGGMLAIVSTSLYRSVDGGNTWSRAIGPGNERYVDYSGLQVIDQQNVVYVRPLPAQGVFFSEDAGATWTAAKSIEPAGYSRSALQKSGPGVWLARQDSSYYLSVDKGKNWAHVAGVLNQQLNEGFPAHWFFDSKRGFLLSSQGDLKETTDAGLTWTAKLSGLQIGSTSKTRLQFTSAKFGWLSVGDGRVYRSEDGGASWDLLPATASIVDFQFIDESLGWARAPSTNDLLQTKDGGQTWFKSGDWPASNTNFRFRDANRGLVGGYSGQIYQTADGGKTWVSRYSGVGELVEQLQYVDDKVVWALSSSAVLRSLDGGDSWTAYRPGNQDGAWSALSFVDANHGWVVGAGGRVLATQDGGKTWVLQISGTTKHLTAVKFIDVKTGWIMGEQGTILATGTGGN